MVLGRNLQTLETTPSQKDPTYYNFFLVRAIIIRLCILSENTDWNIHVKFQASNR
jgi:hypothetical protein